MMGRKKRIDGFLLLLLLLLAACGGNGAGKGGAGAEADTTATATGNSRGGKAGSDAGKVARAGGGDELRVALPRTVDCLPFYYAEASGIYRKLGLKGLRLLTFASQMDADTALLRGRVQGGVTDLVRLQYYCGRGHRIVGVAATDGRWELVACKGLRIRKVEQLKGRIVAVSRLSRSDFLTEAALQGCKLDYGDVYRPQINDYHLRAAMLDGNQVDAAVLPEPYATVARLAGHRLLPSAALSGERMGILAFRADDLGRKATAEKVKLLLRGYDMAVDSLNRHGVSACVGLLTDGFHLEKAVADSLRLPRYGHARLPRSADAEKARAFLKRRGQAGNGSAAALVLDGSFLP